MTTPISLEHFVDVEQCLHKERWRGQAPFALLGKGLGPWLVQLLGELGVSNTPVIRGKVAAQAIVEGAVFIAEGAVVEPTAMIQGPCYIGPGSEVRHGAYIRGQVYVGRSCVVGHATEVKGSIFFDEAKAGHFAYVGDSILGRDTNLGAGTKLANLPLRRGEIRVRHPDDQSIVSTGLKKFGAIMGDRSQTGCNAVLSPGTLLLPGTAVLPCVHYRGTLTQGLAR